MSRSRPLLPVILVLFACGVTQAASLEVSIGWEGHFRAGRWAPLFITVADTSSRPVILEVFSPHGNGTGMQTRLAVTASPAAATYPLYVPLAHGSGDLLVVLRDARTERLLAEWPSPAQRSTLFMGGGVAETLIGTSGRSPTLRHLHGNRARDGLVVVAHIDPLRLPLSAAGLDALNLLVLNQPDLNRITLEQQQAIADWVRLGGNLLIWAGDDPLPPSSPLLDMLPCEIGPTTLLEIDLPLLASSGLAERFRQLRGRELHPRPGALPVPTLAAGGPQAWRAGVGYGQVLVLPFDPSLFVFRNNEASDDFWQPLLAGTVDLRPQDSLHPSQYWSNAAYQRRSSAFNRAADLLGDVPGVGEFGFR
jgi:hypothetical protein